MYEDRYNGGSIEITSWEFLGRDVYGSFGVVLKWVTRTNSNLDTLTVNTSSRTTLIKHLQYMEAFLDHSWLQLQEKHQEPLILNSKGIISSWDNDTVFVNLKYKRNSIIYGFNHNIR